MNPHRSSALALLTLFALALPGPLSARAARQPDGVSSYQNQAHPVKTAQPYTQLKAVHPQTGATRGAQRGDLTLARGNQALTAKTAKTAPADALETKSKRTKDPLSVNSKKNATLVFADQTKAGHQRGPRDEMETALAGKGSKGGKKPALGGTFAMPIHSLSHRSSKLEMTTPAIHARHSLPRGGETTEDIFHNSSYTRRVHVAQQTVEHKSPWADPSAKHAVKVLPGKEGMAKLRGTQNVFAASKQPSRLFVPAGKRPQQENRFFQSGEIDGTKSRAKGHGLSTRAVYR